MDNYFGQMIYMKTLKEWLKNKLRKEQEKNNIDIYVKELKDDLESCSIQNTLTYSEYEGIFASENRYDKLLELIQPATKLQSEFLNCSEYYYNADRDTIFEITTVKPNERLTIVDQKVDVTLRELNGLPLIVTS